MGSVLTIEKKMPLKEVAEATGAAYRTIADYAHRAGWTQNGKKTLLNERQVTLILEAMKESTGQGGKRTAMGKDRLALSMQGIETVISPILRLKIIQEQKDVLHEKEIEIYKKELNRVEIRAITAEAALWREIMARRETKTGLETYQRIAETHDLTMSDRDDILATYKRR